MVFRWILGNSGSNINVSRIPWKMKFYLKHCVSVRHPNAKMAENRELWGPIIKYISLGVKGFLKAANARKSIRTIPGRFCQVVRLHYVLPPNQCRPISMPSLCI